jgi:hypothetical protein
MTPTPPGLERRCVDDKKASAAPLSHRAPASEEARAVLDPSGTQSPAAKLLQWHSPWSAEFRLVVLTILNALLYWPWHLLRVAFDAGDHHPTLALGLLLLTLWLWFELCTTILMRFKR